MDETGKGTGRRIAVVGIPALALLGVALYLAVPRRAEAPGGTPASPPAADPAPATEAEVAPTAAAPAFDVVRVEPDGAAIVAGTAAPGATVTIYADRKPLAEATADADGNFVATFDAPASATPQALTLGATSEAGATAASDDVVVLLPPAPAAGVEPGVGSGVGSAPGPGDDATQAEAAKTPTAVAATAIIRPGSVEVAPAGGDPGAVRDVALGTISYGETGAVTVSGLGTAGAAVRAYVDDRLAGEGRVAADGRWSLGLPDMAKGVYRLRVDELGDDGRVASRVETPFQRDMPRAPMKRPGEAGATDLPGMVTVQPGTNLWTLARLHYGSGTMYTQIFTANRSLIRDPDLIYPGQIFDLPEMGR